MTSAEADDEPAESNGVVSATEPIDAAFRGVPDVRAAALANAGSVAIESGPKSSTSISSFVPKPVQSMSEQTAGLLERLKLPKTESENASSSSRIESKSHSDQQKSHGYRSSADASSSFVIDSVPAITRVNAAGQRLYCLCNEPYDDSNAAAELGQAERPAVCCVSCEDWFA